MGTYRRTRLFGRHGANRSRMEATCCSIAGLRRSPATGVVILYYRPQKATVGNQMSSLRERSNSRLLTDAYPSALRASFSAAKPGR